MVIHDGRAVTITSVTAVSDALLTSIGTRTESFRIDGVIDPLGNLRGTVGDGGLGRRVNETTVSTRILSFIGAINETKEQNVS